MSQQLTPPAGFVPFLPPRAAGPSGSMSIERSTYVLNHIAEQLLKHPDGRAIGMETREALRVAVSDYATRLRELGVPPEQVVIGVKQAVGEPLRRRRTVLRDPAEMVAEVVRWSIDAYFQPPRRDP